MTVSTTPTRSPPCPSRARPVDLIHLSRQTNGNGQLEAEVLALMQRHLRRVLEEPAPTSRDAAVALAYATSGAARNLGAFPLAAAADALLADVVHADAPARFRSEAERTLRFIAALAERRGALTGWGSPTTCAA